MSRNRLQNGLIDKTKEIHFSFNGRNLIDGKGAHRIATEIIKMVNKR